MQVIHFPSPVQRCFVLSVWGPKWENLRQSNSTLPILGCSLKSRASLGAQLVKNQLSCLQGRRPQFNSWVRKIPWRREQLLTPIFWPGEFHGLDRLPTPVFLVFLGGSAGKESACNVDLGSIPGWCERSPGEGNGYPLQYSGPENSIDCIVHGVAKSRTRLSDTFEEQSLLMRIWKSLFPVNISSHYCCWCEGASRSL